MLKKVIGHSVIYSIGPQLPKIIGIFLLPIITPKLTASDFGIWGIVNAYIIFLSMFRDLGMSVPLINSFYNEIDIQNNWSKIYTLLVIYGLPFILFQSIILFFVIPSTVIYENKIILIILFTIQSLLLDPNILLGTRFFQLSEKPIPISIISFITGIIYLVIQYISVIHYNLGYMSWFFAGFTSNLILGGFYKSILKINKIRLTKNISIIEIKNYLRIGIPIIPHNISSYILNVSDRILMTFFGINNTKIGIYNTAYMFGNYAETFGGAVGNAISPIYFRLLKNKNKFGLFALNNFLACGFIVGLSILSLWMKEINLFLIKNDELKNIYPLAIILLMSYTYRPIYWVVVNTLQFHEKVNSIWKITFSGAILNIVLNIVFIPIFDFKVAAITTYISLIFIGLIGYILKDFKLLESEYYNHKEWILIIIINTLIIYFLRDIIVFFKIIISIIYIIPLIFFGTKLNKINFENR